MFSLDDCTSFVVDRGVVAQIIHLFGRKYFASNRHTKHFFFVFLASSERSSPPATTHQNITERAHPSVGMSSPSRKLDFPISKNSESDKKIAQTRLTTTICTHFSRTEIVIITVRRLAQARSFSLALNQALARCPVFNKLRFWTLKQLCEYFTCWGYCFFIDSSIHF